MHFWGEQRNILRAILGTYQECFYYACSLLLAVLFCRSMTMYFMVFLRKLRGTEGVGVEGNDGRGGAGGGGGF